MKRKAFEEIVEEEFRWPKEGDDPFVAVADPLANATISGSDTSRMALMMDGYKIGADIMVRHAEINEADRDFLVCPIIFNYRQFLELSLKYMLAVYGRYVGVQANWSTHFLDVLWKDFALILERFGTEDPDEADPVVANIVAQFAKIDPGSYSHRYPFDRRGRPIPLAITDLHLPALASVMDAVSNYFSGCDGYLGNLASTQS